jgi:hypothetical protein
MSEQSSASCSRTAASVVGDTPVHSEAPIVAEKKETGMTARVGQKAPDFTTMAYYKGNFVPVKLADYLGKWVMLCFYPGDFTFV